MAHKAPRPTRAERLHAHREAFNLALREGITPREAEALIALRAASSRWEQTKRRMNELEDRQLRRIDEPFVPLPATEPEPSPFWWRKD